MAMAVISGIVAVFAMAAVSRYLIYTNVGEPDRSSGFYRVLRKAPLQAFKSIIVVWQILTQASDLQLRCLAHIDRSCNAISTFCTFACFLYDALEGGELKCAREVYVCVLCR